MSARPPVDSSAKRDARRAQRDPVDGELHAIAVDLARLLARDTARAERRRRIDGRSSKENQK